MSRFNTLWEKVCAVATNESISVDMPRTVKKQMHRSNISADTPQVYWKLNLFLPFLDHLTSQLEN